MTDLQKTKALFKEMGAELKETTEEWRIELSTYEAIAAPGIDLGMGYMGFTCSIYFDLNGKFIGMGGYE